MKTELNKGGKDAIESPIGNGSEVPANPPRPFVSIQRTFDDGATQLHNFQGTPMEVYRQIAKACGGGIKGADDLKGTSMQLRHFYCHQVEMTNSQSGEMVNTIRTVLIDADGTPYQFVSQGIATGLDVIRQNFGDGPWVPPIKITVEATKAPKGKVLNIVPLD